MPATLKQVNVGLDSDVDKGYPFARIYVLEVSSPVADTVSYERAWTFAVEVLQEATAKSRRDAELDFAHAIHAVLNRIQGTGGSPAAWQLGIGVENTEVQTSPVKLVETAQGPARSALIRVTVTTLVQNPS